MRGQQHHCCIQRPAAEGSAGCLTSPPPGGRCQRSSQYRPPGSAGPACASTVTARLNCAAVSMIGLQPADQLEQRAQRLHALDDDVQDKGKQCVVKQPLEPGAKLLHRQHSDVGWEDVRGARSRQPTRIAWIQGEQATSTSAALGLTSKKGSSQDQMRSCSATSQAGKRAPPREGLHSSFSAISLVRVLCWAGRVREGERRRSKGEEGQT